MLISLRSICANKAFTSSYQWVYALYSSGCCFVYLWVDDKIKIDKTFAGAETNMRRQICGSDFKVKMQICQYEEEVSAHMEFMIKKQNETDQGMSREGSVIQSSS